MSEKVISEINIIYDINSQNNITIFGYDFVKNNKNICKMIIDNKGYDIQEEYKVKNNKNKKLKIKLKGIDKIINMSSIFSRCSSLSSLPDFSKWDIKKLEYKDKMFDGCKKSLKIPSRFKEKKLFGFI